MWFNVISLPRAPLVLGSANPAPTPTYPYLRMDPTGLTYLPRKITTLSVGRGTPPGFPWGHPIPDPVAGIEARWDRFTQGLFTLRSTNWT